MVNNMSLLHEDRPAEKFVKNMHERRVALDTFIRLFNEWTELTPEERGEVYDICELNHPNMYYGVFPSEDEDDNMWDT